MSLEYAYLEEEEFKSLSNNEKWAYIKSLFKIMDSLKIRADKNCAECEKNLLGVNDLNIDFLFEDWRSCKNICDTMGKCPTENRVAMCDLQFQLMNHIAEEINVLRGQIHGLMRLILRKDERGERIAETLEEALKKDQESTDSMYK